VNFIISLLFFIHYGQPDSKPSHVLEVQCFCSSCCSSRFGFCSSTSGWRKSTEVTLLFHLAEWAVHGRSVLANLFWYPHWPTFRWFLFHSRWNCITLWSKSCLSEPGAVTWPNDISNKYQQKHGVALMMSDPYFTLTVRRSSVVVVQAVARLCFGSLRLCSLSNPPFVIF